MHSVRTAAAVVAALLLARSASASPLEPALPELEARLLAEVDQARAIPDLYRLYERRDDSSDLKPLLGTLEAVAANPKARADVRATALEMRAQLAQAQAQLPQARALFDRIAPVRSWSVIGPFDNDGRRGFVAQYEPEKDGFDPKAVYKGKEHDVAWRALPDGHAAFGFVDLTAAIYPRQEVAVYAATVLRAKQAAPAVFHLGASGATKVWLNGRLIHSDASIHPSRFDQQSFAAGLTAGDNFVLVKIAHLTGGLGFSLRLGDAHDAPDVALAASARAPNAMAKAFAVLNGPERKPARKVRARFPDALSDLKAAAANAPADARAQEDLAILYAGRRPDDDTERMALRAMERAMDAAPGNAEIALRLARLEDRDANKRRAALEGALEKNPLHDGLLVALSAYRLERGEGWVALELARKARDAAPASLDATLAEARALDAVGFTARAAILRLDAGKVAPGLGRSFRATAAALRRLGRTREAREALTEALKTRFDDREARGELVGLLLDEGDLDGALKLLGEAAALDPGGLYPRLRAAELLSQDSRAGAEQAFAQAVTLAPDDPEPHEQLGRHRLRAHDESGALAAFARSLSLRPQNPSLRELVRAVHPEEQYATPYLYDAAVLARLAPLQNEDLEVLSDLSVTKVFANGLSSRTRQVIIRPITQRGVDQARVQSLTYSPDRQMVRVERARILRKDGSYLESKSEGERNVSEPWYGLFYDVRARVISFPQLEPGDVVELITRLDDSGSNFFADYFGDFTYLQGTQPRRVSDYVLLGPAGRSFHSKATRLEGLVASEGKLPDGGTWHRWTVKDVSRIAPEPSMPGYSELLGYVHVSTYKTWDDVGRFYWGLIKDQLRVTDDVRTAAREAVKGIPEGDELARIRAVYGFVVSRTRYVGLEFGINSFKPYPVETILSRRFGDCKDKASLMHAMLESLGIDSRITLLRMKRLGGIDSEPASLAVFNHAILYVPKYELFLDGTAEFHGSGELPADDRGAEVLVVDPEGGSKFFRVPEARPQDNFDVTRFAARLAPDGSAEVKMQASAQGSWTAELRRTFESKDERRLRAEEHLARAAFPNVKVTDVEVSDPQDIEKPFETKMAAHAPAFALAVGTGLRFSPFGRRHSFVESWAQLSTRNLPQRLPAPQRTVVEAEIELPQGWTATLPAGERGASPQGAYEITYAQQGGKVTARLELTLQGGLLQPHEYGAFRGFLQRLDVALQRRVETGPVQTAGRLGR